LGAVRIAAVGVSLLACAGCSDGGGGAPVYLDLAMCPSHDSTCDPECPAHGETEGDNLSGTPCAIEGKMCGWFEYGVMCIDGTWQCDLRKLYQQYWCSGMGPLVDLAVPVDLSIGDGGDGGG
jgi:hypothetical protein